MLPTTDDGEGRVRPIKIKLAKEKLSRKKGKGKKVKIDELLYRDSSTLRQVQPFSKRSSGELKSSG